jgi:hypothetical protein
MNLIREKVIDTRLINNSLLSRHPKFHYLIHKIPHCVLSKTVFTEDSF